MKRFVSVLLTLAMLMSMLTVFAVTNVAAATVISNSSPAITANVGETINLSGYSVVFDGDSTATTGVTWKDSSNATVTSYTPDAKGVTALTATSGSKSKTIYVVAKEAAETEYVLYETDFSEYTSISQLQSDGWTLLNNASYYSVSNGALTMGSTDVELTRIILPKWLGDFGDYSVTAEAKMLTTVNTSRWFGLVYRIQDNSSKYYPYYHMCTRENTTNSGIEFAERTASDGWNVTHKASGSITSLKNAYNSFNVKAYGTNIQHNLNGTEVHYVTNTTITGTTAQGSTVGKYDKGYIGLTMNYGTVSVTSIKVTVQETAPEKAPLDLDLISNSHADNNLINPIANVQTVSASSASTVLSGSKAPGIALFDATAASDLSSLVATCLTNKVIPTFEVDTTAEADAVLAALKANGSEDANVISASTEVLSYLRGKTNLVRTGLSITNISVPVLTSEEAHSIRATVRSAPATFCVIPSDVASKQVVSELQELAVAVWVRVSATPDTDDFNVEAARAVASGANGIISQSASALTDVINTYFVASSMTRTPIIIGHRGNPGSAPENTISGFKAAYENGADVFEIDVELTSDGKVIVLHDETLTRTTTYTGSTSVRNMTLEQVKSYKILDKSGNATDETVPTLEEVLKEFQGKDIRIFVEYKNAQENCIAASAALIKQYGMEDQVDVISFHESAITLTQNNLWGMSTGYLLVPSNVDCSSPDYALNTLYPSLILAQSVRSTINPAWTSLNRNYIQAATDRGMTVWPWTFYGASGINTGFMMACDGITTDNAECVPDMVKFVSADDINLSVGQYAVLPASATTYRGDSYTVPSDRTVISIITGNDIVKAVDGRLVALKEGVAQVMFGYTTSTSGGGTYVAYSQPVTVTVKDGNLDAVAQLKAITEDIYFGNYSESVLAQIREVYATASTLNEATDASVVNATCAQLAVLLNSESGETVVSYGKNYTSNGAMHSTYIDDGKLLTDGATTVYSGWSSTAPNVVEVTVDLERADAATNIYNIYLQAGQWGINNPTGNVSMEILASDSATSGFTSVASTSDVVLLSGTGVDDGTWSKYRLTVTAQEDITARYVKFVITNNEVKESATDNNHIWLSEVEAVYSTGDAVIGGIGISGFDSKVNAGDTVIFTPDFGTITVDTANHAWTANLIAKLDSETGKYVVKSVTHGAGASTADITLASDEILISAHAWEDGAEDDVPHSKSNKLNLLAAKPGDELVLHNIDIETQTIGVASYIGIDSKNTDSTFWATHYNNNLVEGAGVIFTKEYTGAGWSIHVAFAPVSGLDNVYEITAISNGLSDGSAAALSIPAGGFVWAANYGNDYPTISGSGIDYTSDVCNAAIDAAQGWKVGDRITINGLFYANGLIPTTTPDTNWYDDSYICTATYSFYSASDSSDDTSSDVSDDEYDSTVYDNIFWVTHYNDNTAEGAGVIFTEAYTDAKWWIHVAFAPTDVAGTYKITAISDGTPNGSGTALAIPEGGFVWAANYGNDYPAISGSGIDYTSATCDAAVKAARLWKVGDAITIGGLRLSTKTVPTNTPALNWYDDGYSCTATYKLTPAASDDTSGDTSDEPIESGNALWVTHYNDLTVEGAGVIVTDGSIVTSAWNNYYAFAPVEGTNAYELTYISLGNTVGTGVFPTEIPEGGFVYSLNQGNDYPSLNMGTIDYTSESCFNMIADALNWSVGDRFVFHGIDLENFTVPTTTSDLMWYKDGYVCTATYEAYVEQDTSEDSSEDSSVEDSSDDSSDVVDEYDVGDVNADGAIDQFDYLLVKRAYFNTYSLTAEEERRADVDYSGTVDQYDYVLLKRSYFGTYTIVQKK